MISDELQSFCGILLTPMGKSQTLEESEKVPQLHPQLMISKDHFTKNSAFTTDKYLPLDEVRKAYSGSQQISFNDVTEYVNFIFFILSPTCSRTFFFSAAFFAAHLFDRRPFRHRPFCRRLFRRRVREVLS